MYRSTLLLRLDFSFTNTVSTTPVSICRLVYSFAALVVAENLRIAAHIKNKDPHLAEHMSNRDLPGLFYYRHYF